MQVIAHQNNAREAWRPGVETRMLVSAGSGAAQLCTFEQWVAPGTPEQKQGSELFFGDNRGWGFGVSVFTKRDDLFSVPGRFG